VNYDVGSSTSTGSYNANYEIAETGNADQIIIGQVSPPVISGLAANTPQRSAAVLQARVCGSFDLDSSTKQTFRLLKSADSVGVVNGVVLEAGTGGDLFPGKPSVHFEVQPL
jgi:hypothetical protein